MTLHQLATTDASDTLSAEAQAIGKGPTMSLSGAEKAAVLILCMGEERGSAIMQQLEESQIQTITQAISRMPPIHAEVAERVIAEFVESAASIRPDALETAKSLLASFLPEEKVESIMKEIGSNASESAFWQEIGNVDEKMIADYLTGEQDQAVAVVASNLPSAVAARVLPLLGQERMMRILQIMLSLEDVPDHLLDQIEVSLQADVLDSISDPADNPTVVKMAELFDNFDEKTFDAITEQMRQDNPEEFELIRSQMFTFKDLIRIESQNLARVMRGVTGNTVPLALKGADEDLRNHFLGALPGRSRDMLVEEMDNMGPVRARDVRDARSALVECAKQLLAQDVIQLIADAEEGEQEEYVE